MAKLPRTGVGYQCLYEYDCTLQQVMASLGLKPLSKKAERKLRDRLGFALAKWEEPYSPIEVKDIVSSLNSYAKGLDKFAPLVAVAKGGFSRSDEIEVACQLAQILSEDSTVGSIEAAHAYLADFWNRAGVIASVCRSAAKKLLLTKGRSGRSPYDWYDEFTAVLLDVCKHNNIDPTVAIDRSSGEPVSGLADVASGFERLLLPIMRSPTPSAMIKRLQRSLARLEQRLRAAPR
jgi:hypothetical protein